MLGSAVLGVVFAILLSIQIKKYGVQDWGILKRVKTWIYIFALVLLTFLFVDNLIVPSAMKWTWNTFIHASIALFRQLTALALFQYFMKRSVRLMTPDQAQSL